jgi:hypothetical protein
MRPLAALLVLTFLPLAGHSADPNYDQIDAAPDYLAMADLSLWDAKELPMLTPKKATCGVAGCKCGCVEGGACTCKPAVKPKVTYRPPAYRATATTATVRRQSPPAWICGPDGCYPAPTYNHVPAPQTTYTYRVYAAPSGESGCSGSASASSGGRFSSRPRLLGRLFGRLCR